MTYFSVGCIESHGILWNVAMENDLNFKNTPIMKQKESF